VRTSEPIPGVTRFWFPGLDNNAYLIAGDEPTLIDCGPSADLGRRSSNAPADRAALEVRHVAVTHCHTDHTGGLAEVIRASGATVYAHRSDVGIIRDGAERPRGVASRPLGRNMLALAKRSSRADPAPVHVEIRDEQLLPAAGGLRCIHTPGHTAGHMSFLWPEVGGVLFVGDAAANMFRRLAIAPINEDTDTARTSFRRLAELDFEHACFGHGSPIRAGAASTFRRTLEHMASD
jgi:glyoxylase-like metal-dependent hydrolase (beta-lactamase superfamily II)